jgi:hypothetical protein
MLQLFPSFCMYFFFFSFHSPHPYFSFIFSPLLSVPFSYLLPPVAPQVTLADISRGEEENLLWQKSVTLFNYLTVNTHNTREWRADVFSRVNATESWVCELSLSELEAEQLNERHQRHHHQALHPGLGVLDPSKVNLYKKLFDTRSFVLKLNVQHCMRGVQWACFNLVLRINI